LDTKKLIGTIIGVTMFAVLIAGATFAWLTFGTTLVETNVTTSNSMNFIVDYTNGQDITNLPMLDSTLAKPEEAAMLSVTANKHSNSVNGHLVIMLTNNATTGKTGSEDLLTDGIVRWAICRGTPCTGNFNNAVNAGIAQGVGTAQVLLNDAALADGHAKKNNGSTDCTVANDLKTMTKTTITKPTTTVYGSFANTEFTGYSVCNGLTRKIGYNNGSAVNNYLIGNGGSTAVTYYVYFWLDGETIGNGHKNQTYSGYIHAAASQLVE
jgi:hypothetical protein